jgi:predicted methyltransferase
MHLTVEAQRICRDSLFPGAIAIDATAGNGFDTHFLAMNVGDTGIVYAIDIQPVAMARVQQRLVEENLSHRVRCVIDSHSHMEQIVAPEHVGQVACVMFNLGYLPLSDKSIVTCVETTMPAVLAAARMLRVGGRLSILAYVGQSGGREEAEQISKWIAFIPNEFKVDKISDSSNPLSPILWSLRRK